MAVLRPNTMGARPRISPRRRKPRDKTGRSGLHISLHARHLPRKADARVCKQLIAFTQYAGRGDKRIAVHDAIAQKFRLFKARNHGKHPFLLAVAQMRLKADEVIRRPLRVVAPELDAGVRLAACPRVRQPDGLERPVRDRLMAAPGHNLDRHTALEHLRILKSMHFGALRRNKRVHKAVVLVLLHRAVDVVGAPPSISGRENARSISTLSAETIGADAS